MTCTGLGKVTVATAGTPIQLSSKTSIVKCHRIVVTFDVADGAGVSALVKDVAGNVYGAVSSVSPGLVIGGDSGNSLDITKFSIDASTNSKGPYVGIDVI